MAKKIFSRTTAHLLHAPLLHFLLLGALLYALEQAWPEKATIEPLVVTAADAERLRAQWRFTWAREPSEAEMQGLLRRYVDEEVLVREALRLGLDTRDKVARERQVRNLRFALPESQANDAALLRTARALHMAERDPVVRARLAQAMTHRLSRDIPVSDAEMQAYLDAHSARYAEPARYGFSQRYFREDAGDGLARALAALAALSAGRSDAPAGDGFLLGAQFSALSESEIARQLGAAVAQAVRATAPGQWSEPVRSAYGWHLVRVERREAATAGDFRSLRRRLAYAVLEEKSQEAVQDALRRLRARYGVDAVGAAG